MFFWGGLKSLPVSKHLLPHPFMRLRALAHFLGLASSLSDSIAAMVSYCPICGKPVYFGESFWLCPVFLTTSLTSCFFLKLVFPFPLFLEVGGGGGSIWLPCNHFCTIVVFWVCFFFIFGNRPCMSLQPLFKRRLYFELKSSKRRAENSDLP